ncbi:PP2C family protein-serine/threonine phosphatase [Streptomyces sp. UNOB3_S3]|uniref:PP2C family protein-serine/threonine phosphatase n=1 Tax=Streptomyces sp. UNOB3_S3 TaxID=2871682 RepID=UPI001E354C11|nr:PP2C family protein-serine/threonine phosphatase [Streptomyces sp. UNOB3_S3]MCC3777505.1 serine/threonine-protein phosphatase [Streptomyces sp. UNOB3_S3]
MARSRDKRSDAVDDLLTALGRLSDQALERVELQQARVELAIALQKELLPSALPTVPGLRSAARYAPARHGLDIGGDWYDGFRLPDGALGFSIGDVQGHDVEAAAFMGQIRIGLRAVAAVVPDPGEVLSRTNDLLVSMECGLFATCTFLRVDPATGEMSDARAGHVPAVWATGNGDWGVAEEEGGPPLGILPAQEYPVTRRLLADAEALVLFTDGIVEGPAFPIEAGLAEVARLVRARVHADPGELADEVIKIADLTGHTDDAAVLVLSRGPEPAERG